MESAIRRLESASVTMDSTERTAQLVVLQESMETLVSSLAIPAAPGTRAPSKPENASVPLEPKEHPAIKNATRTSLDTSAN